MTAPPQASDEQAVPTHALSVFVAQLSTLSRFRALVPIARIYAIVPGAELLVLPFDEDVQDALHSVNGTGDWPEEAAYKLSTNDFAFAASLSRGGRLAYLETDYRGVSGTQTAALWIDGETLMPPVTLDTRTAIARPKATWPINAALRGLGERALASDDEFTRFGLRFWAKNADIHARARRIA